MLTVFAGSDYGNNRTVWDSVSVSMQCFLQAFPLDGKAPELRGPCLFPSPQPRIASVAVRYGSSDRRCRDRSRGCATERKGVLLAWVDQHCVSCRDYRREDPFFEGAHRAQALRRPWHTQTFTSPRLEHSWWVAIDIPNHRSPTRLKPSG